MTVPLEFRDTPPAAKARQRSQQEPARSKKVQPLEQNEKYGGLGSHAAIEASLILSLMFAGGDSTAVLPRDTIYAAVMIICSGVVGICVLIGGLGHREQTSAWTGPAEGSLRYALYAIDMRHREPFRYYKSGSPFEYEVVRLLYIEKRKLQIAK